MARRPRAARAATRAGRGIQKAADSPDDMRAPAAATHRLVPLVGAQPLFCASVRALRLRKATAEVDGAAF